MISTFSSKPIFGQDGPWQATKLLASQQTISGKVGLKFQGTHRMGVNHDLSGRDRFAEKPAFRNNWLNYSAWMVLRPLSIVKILVILNNLQVTKTQTFGIGQMLKSNKLAISYIWLSMLVGTSEAIRLLLIKLITGFGPSTKFMPKDWGK